MSETRTPSAYSQLVGKTLPQPATAHTVEQDLDALVAALKTRPETSANGEGEQANDPVQALRKKIVSEFVPVFVELMEKYHQAGISMQMDASNFLEGGREIKFEFGLGEFRTQMHGTVTAEGIAFHETRYSPEFQGELTSGPMLRLRSLNATTFREFVCNRLTTLLRSASRRR